MEAEEFLKLFDSCWFERGTIFTSKQDHLPAAAAKFVTEKSEESTKFSRLQNLQIRSLSDRRLGVNICERSLMVKPKLQKILSGKEVTELSKEQKNAEKSPEKKASSRGKIKGGKGMMRRSLSALEFEELKGFMDLGFVFTEEDRNSSLVSIIPGLQKWGEKMEGRKCGQVWNNYKNPLINWTIPSQQNEISMKDHLRNWAQTVASIVR